MKRKLLHIVCGWIVGMALLACIFFGSRIGYADLNGTYITLTTSVNSSTVPVCVMLQGAYAAYDIRSTGGATNQIDCWHYVGSCPAAKPTNAWFAVGGNAPAEFYDNQVQTTKFLPQTGIACVLDSGSSAATVTSDARTG